MNLGPNLQDAIIIPTQKSTSLFFWFCFLVIFLAVPPAAHEISVPQTGIEPTPEARLL